MKLKCIEHKRRVMLLVGTNAVHREDGSICRSPRLVLGDKTFVRGTRGYVEVGSAQVGAQ